jgi:hypothetical protein
VQEAEQFASNELAGIRAAAGNSGIPGDGPRRKAAMEAVANAKDHDQQITAALEAARNRLSVLRQRSVSTGQTAQQQSHEQLPLFESRLAAEDAKLASMKDQLTMLTGQRDAAIRKDVEAAPDYVPPNNGLLAQASALDQIAHENPRIAVIIILVDLTSFGFELAAVLAKVTSFVPTTFAALLARAAYLRVVNLVDEMITELNHGEREAQAEPEFTPPSAPPDQTIHRMAAAPDTDPFTNPAPRPPPAAKRPRGRPPKAPSNGTQSFSFTAINPGGGS